jgi:hypothetical protein
MVKWQNTCQSLSSGEFNLNSKSVNLRANQASRSHQIQFGDIEDLSANLNQNLFDINWEISDRHPINKLKPESNILESGGELPLYDYQLPFAKPKLTIAVNLSGRQFAQPDLIEQIQQVLAETGLDSQYLKLEITESVVMGDGESAVAMLSQLRDLGIHLSIDDFGTGYSSLSYLHRFPINTLKIDRSFVSRIGADGENIEIVRAIIMLAHSLGMDVVAEGVETAHHLAQLRSLGCEFGQGYFFSKPVDSEAATALLNPAIQW